jgi:signal transduction histidine kinase
MAVNVWDGAGKEVWAAPGSKPVRHEIKRKPTFLLTRWTIALGSRGPTGAQMARTNFYVNLALATLLAAVLLAGVALAMRTAARAMKLSEMKSDFVSNVSHELRTPVASIRAFGELLALGRADEAKAREYGERIEAESRRLTALINDILDFSRIESGETTLSLEAADAGEIAAGALEGCRGRLEQRGFRAELRRPARPLPIRADAAALGRAVSNLLDNALKYSGPALESTREIAVDVGLEPRPPRGAPGTAGGAGRPWATIAVRDRGIGIPREEQGRIFERFHRVSSSLVHDVKGSGLGLALVDQIVRAHGGRVTVESEPGQGSTFTLWLPLDPAAEPETVGEELASSPAPSGAARELGDQPAAR